MARTLHNTALARVAADPARRTAERLTTEVARDGTDDS